MIKERPILFSAPMVQALLAGKKTQTRRKVKKLSDFSPYGRIGDRLWVRESAHQAYGADSMFSAYSADGSFVRDDEGVRVFWWYSRDKCPSIHLPRRFSRILLEITDVRLEQLWDITESDCVSEGIKGHGTPFGDWWEDYSSDSNPLLPHPYASYKTLWEKINGTASWNSNPWVWVIEFKRVNDAT